MLQSHPDRKEEEKELKQKALKSKDIQDKKDESGYWEKVENKNGKPHYKFIENDI